MNDTTTEKKTTRTILQIKHYQAPQPGWYLLNFFDADLQIGPFATAELAKKELGYFQATSDAAWKRSIRGNN